VVGRSNSGEQANTAGPKCLEGAMGNHTPGPWIIGTDPRYPSEPCIDAVVDGVVWHIALCHMGLGPDDASADANARLIACAPELYAVLKEALPSLRGERYEQALAILEKAEGVRPLTRRNGSLHNHG
jgi:hypothetical protein